MCIIIVSKDDRSRVTPDILRRMVLTNRDGVGIGYREKGKVHWLKGLDANSAELSLEGLPVPYVVHARFATVGGSSGGLTHPFPIESYPSLDEYGSTDGAVLFHNGHVTYWDAMLELLGTDTDTTGPWSDSRAVAHVLAGGTAKPGFLKWLAKDASSRFAVLSPSKLRLVGTWQSDSDGRFLSTSLPTFPTPGKYTGASYCYTGGTGSGVTDTADDDRGASLVMSVEEWRAWQKERAEKEARRAAPADPDIASKRASFFQSFDAGQKAIADIRKDAQPVDNPDVRRMDADAGLDFRKAMERGD